MGRRSNAASCLAAAASRQLCRRRQARRQTPATSPLLPLPTHAHAHAHTQVDDDVAVNVHEVSAYLRARRTQANLYIGCMKSGDVLTDKRLKW